MVPHYAEIPVCRTADVSFSSLVIRPLLIRRRTEKSCLNLFKSNRTRIVFKIILLIWNQTGFCLVPNQSENGKYKVISVSFNNIQTRFLCVYIQSPDWKNLHRLSEKLASLGIMEAQSGASLKLLNTIVL